MVSRFALASVMAIVLLVGLAGGHLLDLSFNQQTSGASTVSSPTIAPIASNSTNVQTTATNNQTLTTNMGGPSSNLSPRQSSTQATDGGAVNVVIG